jgi:hypothetical protein
MKVALVLSGQPRKYDIDRWKHLINELNADVFIHTWYGQDRGGEITDINKIISEFQPKEISISNPHKFLDIIPEDSYFVTTSYHTINLSFSMSNAIINMMQYSNMFDKKYDVVIRSRFDLLLSDVNKVVEAIKVNSNSEFLFVASNHWQGHNQFDDNIMFGNFKNISYFSNYYGSVIEEIYKTKEIQTGERSMFEFCNKAGFLQNIKRISELDFEPVRIPLSKLILNQNEE